jgi:hypothetical protein
MENTDVTYSHRTWKDVTVQFSAFPSLIQIHGHKTCIQGLFDIMQIHLQVIGYQFINMVKHLPLPPQRSFWKMYADIEWRWSCDAVKRRDGTDLMFRSED